jgi:hypothetical protein
MRKSGGRLAAASLCAGVLAADVGAQSPAPAESAPSPPAQVLIDFEDFTDLGFGEGPPLGERYRANHGVRFGLGARVAACEAASPEDAAARGFLCPYPRGASGAKVGYFNQQADELEIGFDRAPTTVSLAINPTGGALGEAYQVILTAFDASDALIGRTTTNAVWGADAFTWPTRVSFAGQGRAIARLLVATSRGRFFFDDLRLDFGPPGSPVFADILAAPAAPPVVAAQTVETNAASALRLYSPAAEVRVAIDWDAAAAAAGRQQAAGLAAIAPADRAGLDAALLPVLLPLAADAGSVDVSSTGDTFFTRFQRGGRGYSVYGSRRLADLGAGASEPISNFQAEPLEYGMSASFSVYGAAYLLYAFCTADEMRSDNCGDEADLRAAARDLAVAIGAAGEARP